MVLVQASLDKVIHPALTNTCVYLDSEARLASQLAIVYPRDYYFEQI